MKDFQLRNDAKLLFRKDPIADLMVYAKELYSFVEEVL